MYHALREHAANWAETEMKPPVIADLQKHYKTIRERGIGSSKSAAMEKIMDELGDAISRGFLKREVWVALKEVGYEGGYKYFARKLDRLGITRRQLGLRQLTSRAALGKDVTNGLTAVEGRGEPFHSADPEPLDEVEAQRLRLQEARRRGEIYLRPEPQPKKKFIFNPEN